MKEKYTIEEYEGFLKLTVLADNAAVYRNRHIMQGIFAIVCLAIWVAGIVVASKMMILQWIFVLYWVAPYGYKYFSSVVWHTIGKEYFEVDKRSGKVIFYRKGLRTFDWTECSFSQIKHFSPTPNAYLIHSNREDQDENLNGKLCFAYEKGVIRFGAVLDDKGIAVITKEVSHFMNKSEYLSNKNKR